MTISWYGDVIVKGRIGEGEGHVSQNDEEGCGSDEWFLLPIPG